MLLISWAAHNTVRRCWLGGSWSSRSVVSHSIAPQLSRDRPQDLDSAHRCDNHWLLAHLGVLSMGNRCTHLQDRVKTNNSQWSCTPRFSSQRQQSDFSTASFPGPRETKGPCIHCSLPSVLRLRGGAYDTGISTCLVTSAIKRLTRILPELHTTEVSHTPSMIGSNS